MSFKEILGESDFLKKGVLFLQNKKSSHFFQFSGNIRILTYFAGARTKWAVLKYFKITNNYRNELQVIAAANGQFTIYSHKRHNSSFLKQVNFITQHNVILL